MVVVTSKPYHDPLLNISTLNIVVEYFGDDERLEALRSAADHLECNGGNFAFIKVYTLDMSLRESHL